MFELNKTKEVEELISVTKSDSGISGPKLAKAHIRLGELLAENIDDNYDLLELLKKFKKKFSRKIIEVKRKED